jgi:hypothetical protein
MRCHARGAPSPAFGLVPGLIFAGLRPAGRGVANAWKTSEVDPMLVRHPRTLAAGPRPSRSWESGAEKIAGHPAITMQWMKGSARRWSSRFTRTSEHLCHLVFKAFDR